MQERNLAFDPTPEGLVRPLRLAYPGEWARVRDRRVALGDLACDICETEQPTRKKLPAHEVHDFNRPGVARLEKIVFICQLCHDAIHLERTRRVAGKEYVSAVEAQYCKVKGVSPEQLEHDFAAMKEVSANIRKAYRGSTKPAMDYGDYQAGADASEKRKRTDVEDDSDFELYPDHECPWDVGHAD